MYFFCIFAHAKKLGLDMKLIILTRPTYFVEEDKIITSLFEEGMDSLHLFKPNTSPLFYAERLLTLIPKSFSRKIIVHEHFYLASEYDLGGIHLEQVDNIIPTGFKGNITATCNDISILKGNKKKFKYIFLDNVLTPYNECQPVHSYNILEEAQRNGLIDKKVYAMTNLSTDNIAMVKNLGFGGIVVRDDLWKHFNIHSQTDYRNIIEQFKKIKRAIG